MDQTRLIKFLVVWVVNSVVLTIVSQALSGAVVLGNAILTRGAAAVFVGLLIAILFYLTPLAVERSTIKIKDERLIAVLNFIVAIVGIWTIKRLAVLTGLGIKNILFVIIVAALVAVVSFGVEKYSRTLLGKK